MSDIASPAPGSLTGLGGLAERLGIRVLTAAPERVVATMPVVGNTQPYGLLHGGATAALAETVASVAADLSAGPGRAAVGIELNASHHRAVRSGAVTATARAVHRGRRTASYEVIVVDDNGARVCSARLTCVFVESGGEQTVIGAKGLGDQTEAGAE